MPELLGAGVDLRMGATAERKLGTLNDPFSSEIFEVNP